MQSKSKLLQQQWGEIVHRIGKSINKIAEKALDVGADIMMKELERVSPYMSHEGDHLKDSWRIKIKENGKHYQGKRYVGSVKRVKYGNKRTPLSSILEFGKNSKHRGFMVRAFRNAKPRIIEEMKKTLKEVASNG